MNRLKELIAQLCPDGVEFKRIKDVFVRIKGTPITAGKMKEIEDPDGEIRIFAGGKTVINAKECDIPNANITRTPAVLVQSRGVIDVIFYEKPFTFKNEMWAYTTDNRITVKFLYYILKNNIQEFREAASGMGALPQISLPVTEEFLIPIPPLPVQSEIVQILDNFTEHSLKLIVDLERERTFRKKQYLEYSHALFSQSDCIRNATLGELVDICMCKRIMKSQTDTMGDVPFYQNGTLGGEAKLFISNELFQEYAKKYKFPHKGDVMLSTVGTVGKTIQYDGEPAYFQDSNIVWLKRKTEDVTNEYLYWFCVSMPWKLPERATLKHLHNYMIAETEISIPSKERQAYVIEKFQKLERAFRLIDTELTAEIEARLSQYEFFRDRLLTFKEMEHK